MSAEACKPWEIDILGAELLPLINSDDRFIRVEAGPGTGKTLGLKRRVQRLLHPAGAAVEGRSVLIAAFNRVIALQLRDEIDRLLKDSPHNGKPVVRTIHALSLEAIGGFVRILLPHERAAMIYDVLEEHGPIAIRLHGYDAAEQALADHEAGHKTDHQLWLAVDRWLRIHAARLISDIPGMLLSALKSGDVAGHAYTHVIVDEFQDLTPRQQELMARLVVPGGSFVALGDPRQSIYKFLGNDREGLSRLHEIIGCDPADIRDVPLTECWRCPPAIVSAANQLMGLLSILAPY